TVLLHDDDAEAYRTHIVAYEKEYKPVGLRESELVQSLADTQWRLARIPGLELAIYTRGRCEFADRFEDQAPELRSSMIELETHLKYEKQLRNLQLQESRLARRFEKERAELRELQKQRQTETERRAPASASPTGSTQPSAETSKLSSAANASAAPGFVFSTSETTDEISPAKRTEIAA
ncbi:MAG: hypothetical protein M3Y72_22040, partial [Acidobacteriota bacterium]|nr:hypothetical protein [Acidobacteriota bacterium]MDQ2843670.1 hypothetical protein [Acidobacteriota bacterium]